jgi:hypothetical protein
MRPLSLFICVCTAWLAVPAAASAQDVPDDVLPSRVVGSSVLELAAPDAASWQRQLGDVRRWVAAYEKWKRSDSAWNKRQEQGWLFSSRKRPKRPEPPAWLGAECADVIFADDELMRSACVLWADWHDDQNVVQARQAAAAAVVQKESPARTIWWEHVHFDALWPMTEWRGSVYGVLGMHATIEVAGRFQVFVAPGAILLNLPDGHGSREWRPATDWGIAYRCFDFTFPGSAQRASLHVNLARAWLLSGPSNLFNSTIDLAGFSVTFKRSP